MLHVTCTRVLELVFVLPLILVTTPSAFLGAGRGLKYELVQHSIACEHLCGCTCTYVLAIDLGFVTTSRVLHVYVLDSSILGFAQRAKNSHGLSTLDV